MSKLDYYGRMESGISTHESRVNTLRVVNLIKNIYPDIPNHQLKRQVNVVMDDTIQYRKQHMTSWGVFLMQCMETSEVWIVPHISFSRIGCWIDRKTGMVSKNWRAGGDAPAIIGTNIALDSKLYTVVAPIENPDWDGD